MSQTCFGQSRCVDWARDL